MGIGTRGSTWSLETFIGFRDFNRETTFGQGGGEELHILIPHSAEFGVRLLLIKIPRNVRS
jgi:hypothetical protein